MTLVMKHSMNGYKDVFLFNLNLQLKKLIQNVTQVKQRSPAITQRLMNMTRLNGLTTHCCKFSSLSNPVIVLG